LSPQDLLTAFMAHEKARLAIQQALNSVYAAGASNAHNLVQLKEDDDLLIGDFAHELECLEDGIGRQLDAISGELAAALEKSPNDARSVVARLLDELHVRVARGSADFASCKLLLGLARQLAPSGVYFDCSADRIVRHLNAASHEAHSLDVFLVVDGQFALARKPDGDEHMSVAASEAQTETPPDPEHL